MIIHPTTALISATIAKDLILLTDAAINKTNKVLHAKNKKGVILSAENEFAN